MNIQKVKDRDKLLISEAKVKLLSRMVGYNEIGEPIELVFIPAENEYEWHVGGEYVSRASQQSVLLFVPETAQIAL